MWQCHTYSLPPVLRFRFPANVRQTFQDFEHEKSSPHLLAALGTVLPGLQSVVVEFDGDGTPAAPERPEDRLRQEPGFQELLRLTGGEVLEIRKDSRKAFTTKMERLRRKNDFRSFLNEAASRQGDGRLSSPIAR